MNQYFLASPITKKVTLEGVNGTQKFCLTSVQGWRSQMEDFHYARFNIAPQTSLFAVFDGHGGFEVANFVSRHFAPTLLNNSYFRKGEYEKALYATFLEMDNFLLSPQGQKELAALSLTPIGSSVAGCTACVALIVKNDIYIANAGDSRCVIATKQGVYSLTKDHKPDDSDERRRIERAGGRVIRGRVNGNLNLSRAIGDFPFKRKFSLPADEQQVIANPDLRVWRMTGVEEYLVIGCDGVWDSYPQQKICEFISNKLNSGESIKSTNEALLDSLISKDGKSGLGMDNMTNIIVTFI